jgi:hypothetical protein
LDEEDTWLSAPWLVTEFFVYRRLIEAIGYWNEGTVGYKYDPFAKQKMAGLKSSVGSAGAFICCFPVFLLQTSFSNNSALSH